MKNTLIGSIAISLLVLSVGSAFGQNQVFVSINGTYSNTPLNGTSEDFGDPNNPTADAALPIQNYDGGGAFGLAEAHATAGPGFVRVYTNLSGNGGYDAGINLTVRAEADYDDPVTVVAPGFANGTMLNIHSSWNLAGLAMSGASATGTPPPQDPQKTVAVQANALLISAQLTSEPYLGYSVSSLINSGGVDATPTTADAAGVYPFDFSVRVGQPTDIILRLLAESQVIIGTNDNISFTRGEAYAITDFSHTLAWGGIASVTDENGNPVTGWTVMSQSGFDYSQPFVDVPEPATVALLVLALPGLLLVRCRYRRLHRT